ncbi:MAG TPA: hypothetical protein VEW48_08175 [Thermoanaerobaculia bacterium]|nr:hypothetical protein [Thermoanaerobaculia bacterium]
MTILLSTVRRPCAPSRLLLSALLVVVLIPAGCAGRDYQKLFTESLAKEALTCMHPRGVFESAGEFKDEGNGLYAGTIHWKGAAFEQEHASRVRFKVEDNVAKVYLIDDSAILPAAHQTCEIPLGSE